MADNKDNKQEQRRRTENYRRSRRRRPSRNKKKAVFMKKLAAERIDYLMEKALDVYSDNSEIANRYCEISRNYSMATKVEIPRRFKRLICHKCKKLVLPGISGRVRIQSRKGRGSKLVKTCLNCGKQTTIYIKAKNRED